MHTLLQLRSGALRGTVSLKLSEGLSHFPEEIFELADTLEVLDLSDNQLSELPTHFGRLTRLRIFFCSDNLFTTLPAVLGQCTQLDIVGFKANKIETIHPEALNANLRWLILTGNRITALPSSIGRCKRMQKLMLAGNQLSRLPDELSQCSNLSLLRIAANQLQYLPQWLLSMPRLSWLAYSGNPFCIQPAAALLPVIPWQDLHIHNVLGEGASGIIYRAHVQDGTEQREVAVKVFKGTVTSDGLPQHEMNAFIAAGTHPGLVQLLGQLSAHPAHKPGLIMGLIAPSYHNLGLPPSFLTCTRDVFTGCMPLSPAQLLRIAATIASVACQLHSRGIMHGDLYAHNILVDDEGSTLLGDFGAASFYSTPDAAKAPALERMEVSAFGYLLDDLLSLCTAPAHHPAIGRLQALRNAAIAPQVLSRPSFSQLHHQLAALAGQ